MARRKGLSSPGVIHDEGPSHRGASLASKSGAVRQSSNKDSPTNSTKASFLELLVCVGGIYASFLTWAYLQERMTSRPLSEGGPFKQSVVVYTFQSLFAVVTGSLYLYFSSPTIPGYGRAVPPIFPSVGIIFPLVLVSLTSTFSSSFAFASLKYVDYVTFLLAKSCKLLPVMALHVAVFRKKYPLSKYAVVTAVTVGVAIFTIYHPKVAVEAAKRSAKRVGDATGNTALGSISTATAWGMILLGINLLFDGITNSVQDHIFSSYAPFTDPQMMVAQNLCMSLLNLTYLVFFPRLARSPIGQLVGLSGPGRVVEDQLRDGIRFLIQWPAARWDVLGFAICGAVGQIFIYRTLSRFSSLTLVTVNVTRKMLTMLLSIVLFGHTITRPQWLGVGMVFGGIGAEAAMQRKEKMKKAEQEARLRIERKKRA